MTLALHWGLSPSNILLRCDRDALRWSTALPAEKTLCVCSGNATSSVLRLVSGGKVFGFGVSRLGFKV